MAEVRTVKIKDISIDKKGNIHRGKENEYRIITEADYLANHIEHPNENDPMRYELFNEPRARSGQHPEADLRNQQEQQLEERMSEQTEGDVAKRHATGHPSPGKKVGQRDAKSDISKETSEGKEGDGGKGKDKDKK